MSNAKKQDIGSTIYRYNSNDCWQTVRHFDTLAAAVDFYNRMAQAAPARRATDAAAIYAITRLDPDALP